MSAPTFDAMIAAAVDAAIAPLRAEIAALRALVNNPPDKDPNEKLTVKQAAFEACVCEKTIRRRIADGTLRNHGIGAAVRIRRGDLGGGSK